MGQTGYSYNKGESETSHFLLPLPSGLGNVKALHMEINEIN